MRPQKHPSFPQHDAKVRIAAHRALRRRIALRRCFITLPALALVSLLAAVFLRPTLESPKATTTPLASRADPRLAPPAPAHITTISDEELINVFPPDSCYFAEVNGQKRLVFRDAAVKRQFFDLN